MIGLTNHECNDCGQRMTKDEWTARSDYAMCYNCTYLAELENEHQDGHHEDTPSGFCAMCRDAALVGVTSGHVLVLTTTPVLSMFAGRKFAQFPADSAARILAALA